MGTTPVEGRGSRARFLTTRWSVVLAAGSGDAPHARAALEELCRTYWYPVYGHLRRRGDDPERASDRTQAFFTGLLARRDLARADPARGRFRAWLLSAVRSFLANEWDRETALKRGGGRVPLSIDADQAEARFAREVASSDSPERAFARSWALALLERVHARLGSDYRNAGRAELFRALSPRLTAGGEAAPLAEAARELGKSEGALKVALFRMRARYRELLRAEIAETVADPEEVEDEIRGLFEALGGS